MNPIRIGIDIGGTFTDFVIFRPDTGRIETFKLPSTPHHPAEAVLTGLRRVTGSENNLVIEIIHGSTVATNALLERNGARTALITTRGFGDVIQIGRQERPSLYDLNFVPAQPLVPEDLRFEVDERVNSSGNVQRALSVEQVKEISSYLKQHNPESIAICLLFSFLYPEHERRIAEQLRQEGYFVSLSCEVLPEFREYERTSTTVVNAYVSPVLDAYLDQLETGLRSISSSKLQIMQSNGGAISPYEARQKGVHCILSGPAGGVIGSQYIANQTEYTNVTSTGSEDSHKLITFDMGGTSTDVSLLVGEPNITTEATISELPIRIPLLDIHTIGAGGGSIAYVDAGGALRVGPQSAGADPGPACYGRGELPTVTDANLVLGRLDPDYFLGGKMPLEAERSRQALHKLGLSLGLDSVNAALGVIEVANAHMERALRLISVERGYDPAEFTLLSFGGAGGLHACMLAKKVGMHKIIIPPYASVLSALGMLAANVIKDYSLTVMLPGDTQIDTIESAYAPMVERAMLELQKEGFSEDLIHIERNLDMRYKGQSYELIVPFSDRCLEEFQALHHKEYGYFRAEAPIEIVNLRVRSIGKVVPPQLRLNKDAGPDPARAYIGSRPVIFHEGSLPTPFYRGEELLPGNQIAGPAVIVRDDTTILLLDDVSGSVDTFGNLWLQIHSEEYGQ